MSKPKKKNLLIYILSIFNSATHINLFQVDAESPVDHYTDSRPLDREAAAELFELLVPYVSEKVLKGTQMKSDVKDAFDDIVKQFGHPPSSNGELFSYQIMP